MKNILVLIHDDAGQSARLQVALDIVRALGGHLTCLDVSMVPGVVTDYVSMGGEAMLIAEERAAEHLNRATIEPMLARANIPFDWVDMIGDAAQCLREAGRLTDLIVVNRDLGKVLYPNMLDIVGTLVVEGDVPVLAVPDDAKGLRVERALVAWNGSRDAELALKSAVPLLALAREVTLLEVDTGAIALPAEAAAMYLARHGIAATVNRVPGGNDRPATVILVEAAKGCDLIVMGGYSRPRWVEALFGGTSEKLLAHAPAPVLIAHHR